MTSMTVKKPKKKIDVTEIDITTNPLIDVDIETLDNGTVVITESATDGQPVQTPEGTPLPESEVPHPAEPGDPGFDWNGEYPGEQVFTYTNDNGITVGLAAVSKRRQPTIGFIEDAQDLDEFQQIMRMARFVACDAAWTVLRDWVPSDLTEMWAKWSEFNQANAGE